MRLCVLLPYEFLLEQNTEIRKECITYVLLPYGFLLEQNATSSVEDKVTVLLP